MGSTENTDTAYRALLAAAEKASEAEITAYKRALESPEVDRALSEAWEVAQKAADTAWAAVRRHFWHHRRARPQGVDVMSNCQIGTEHGKFGGIVGYTIEDGNKTVATISPVMVDLLAEAFAASGEEERTFEQYAEAEAYNVDLWNKVVVARIKADGAWEAIRQAAREQARHPAPPSDTPGVVVLMNLMREAGATFVDVTPKGEDR